jgi:preprotein translocase subunit YajC
VVPYASLAVLLVPRQGGNPTFIFIAQMLAIFAIVYFLLFRPQRKEQERHQQMLTAVKKGDEVVTAGGIIGTVVHAEEDRLTIRSGESTRLVVERSRIARVISQKDTKEAKESKE